jgi:hypothetical protein
MPRFLLEHRHAPEECGVVFASFKGDPSPLRRGVTVATCLSGGHAIWWNVDADDEAAALAQLPFFVAARTSAIEIQEITIP